MACKDAKGRLRVAAGCRCDCRYAGSYAGIGRCRCGCSVIDTAHGHSMFVIEKLKEAKETLPEH